MKKITLFALAALTASSAFAANPQVNTMSTRSVAHKLNAQKAVAAEMFRESKSISRADEVEPTPVFASSLPIYRTFDAMYLGSITKDLKQFYYPFGFVPASGDVEFYPIVKADSYAWEWEEFTKGGVVTINTSDSQVLRIPSAPLRQYAGPTLNATDSTSTISYNDSVAEYFAGGYPGLYYDEFEGVGVTPVKYTGDFFWPAFSTVNYSGDESFNEYGTYKELSTRVSSKFANYTDFKLCGLGSYIPGSVAPYLLKGGYALVTAKAKQAVELTITVMGINEEGKIDLSDTIGVGTMMIPEGTTQGFVDFTINAIDSILEVPVESPIIVPARGVYLSISGFNNPEVITEFAIFSNGGNTLDANDFNNPIYDYLIDWDAFLEFECKDPNGDENYGVSSCGALYYANEERTELFCMSEYMICYDVEYPFIANMTQGYQYGDMIIELPVEGDQDGRYFEASQDLMQLIEDEYVTLTVEGDGDWLAYDIAPYEEYPNVFTLAVAAEALPEGVEGRKATFTFTGYGFDNTITVTQGEVANIKDVVAAKAKNGKVYDLQGRVVRNATKGIFIVDGKKVIL